MARFLPIAAALGEVAGRLSYAPTAEQFAFIENSLKKLLVIDPDTGAVAINVGGEIYAPSDFMEEQLSSYWIDRAPRYHTGAAA